MGKMRDTKYATEQCTAKVGENRIERLFIKAHRQEEIRVSWWPKGRMANRPLDVTEEDFVTLIAQGIADGVLSGQFLSKLIVATATATVARR
jgi:hypothetical protein